MLVFVDKLLDDTVAQLDTGSGQWLRGFLQWSQSRSGLVWAESNGCQRIHCMPRLLQATRTPLLSGI